MRFMISDLGFRISVLAILDAGLEFRQSVPLLAASCGFDGGDDDSEDFVGLPPKSSTFVFVATAELFEQLKEELTFVCFFLHDSELGDKLCLRSRSQRRPVIGTDRRSTANQLSLDHPMLVRPRKLLAEVNDFDGEALRPRLHFLFIHASFDSNESC